MALKVVEEWLNACGGCEISILNVGDTLVDLFSQLDFVHIPMLMDHKHYGQLGEKEVMDIPEADVGIITGGIRNEEHKHVAEEMGKRCKTIVALGSCATHGGIPAQANMFQKQEILEEIYGKSKTTNPADIPSQNVPPWLDRVYAVDEVIKVDILVPGCPPHPDCIQDVIKDLLEGKAEWKLPEKSVCDTCPTIREKKTLAGAVKRCFENLAFNPEEGPDKMRCINEQGFFCMGPVTLGGCAGRTGVPRCIAARMSCRGCFGPIRKGANPMVDMMGAMTSIGLDAKTLVDRRAMFNRFIGAHNMLRPLPARPPRR